MGVAVYVAYDRLHMGAYKPSKEAIITQDGRFHGQGVKKGSVLKRKGKNLIQANGGLKKNPKYD